MPFKATVIEDSLAAHGVRLTTVELRYPRFIHAELMTHRVFSRNASSSRAIPVNKLIEQVLHDPARPIHWGKNMPGMQAKEELSGTLKSDALSLWDQAAHSAAQYAADMEKLGIHKQVVNRIIEPFTYISVIVTATEWENFFALRLHGDAQPEIQLLASNIHAALQASIPVLRTNDPSRCEAWHLPYISNQERSNYAPAEAAKFSAARCARVSYLTHDGRTPEVDKDLELYRRLVCAQPMHASPVEHQAYSLDSADLWNKNFRGWYQFRSLLEKEETDPAASLQ